MSQNTAALNEVPTCHGGLENLDEEHDYWIDDIQGDVPEDLMGTFFRNGPGRQRIGGEKYGHWFDGDGMLCAFTFNEGRVHFKNRYVRTPKYVDETAAQKVLYRGFGTQVPGGLSKNFLKMPANPANTNTVYHGGHLLALNEGGKPWKLNPETLETVGEFTYEGSLSRSQVFSAHGKVHPKTGHYFNFGAGMSGIGWRGPKPCINMYHIDEHGVLIRQNQIPLESFPFCHDFAISDRYAIFFLGSIVFGNMVPVMLGTRTIADQIGFDAKTPMQAVVVDLDTLEEVKRFQTDPGSIIHFGNAFSDGNTLVVDGMFTDNFEANDTLSNVFDSSGRFGGGQYRRYFLNMDTGDVKYDIVCPTESEFPTFNTTLGGARNDVTYTACSVNNGANSFFNAIQRITHDGDSKLVTLPPGQYGSEPLYAPATSNNDEDGGYLLEVVYDGFKHRSELQILNARDMAPLAVLGLKHHVPHQFHGFFTPQVFATN